MSQYHKFSITEIEDMIPFERDLYVSMIAKRIDEAKMEDMLQ